MISPSQRRLLTPRRLRRRAATAMLALVALMAGMLGVAAPATAATGSLIAPKLFQEPKAVGETFFTSTWTAVEGKNIATSLVGSLDGSQDLFVDDVLKITFTYEDGSTETLDHNFNGDGFCSGIRPVPELDLSLYLKPGKTTMTIALSDYCGGGGEGNSDIYITGAGTYTQVTPGVLHECKGGTEGNWRFHSYVSDSDGLVVDNAALKGRKAVRALQVPYLNIALSERSARATYRAELRPTPTPQANGITTELIAGTVGCDATRTTASYLVRGLPGGMTLTVRQTYRFDPVKSGDRCEPSGKVTCARFWPTLEWKTSPMVGNPRHITLLSVSTAQRFDFRPDDAELGAWMVGQDKVHAGKNVGLLHYPGTKEFTVSAIGSNERNWDNYHQTSKIMVDMPGNTGAAGCPECIHMHWRWSLVTNAGAVRSNGGFGLTNFTNGRPAVLRGSPQKASITVVREHLDRDETQPQSVDALVNDESLMDGHPIVFWRTSSAGIQQADGSFRDAAFPQLSGKPGDLGSLWFSPQPPVLPGPA
ncbi:hypothetical protein SAMN06264364_10410 [Quadrisphaera granulorum]|uniref:Uncharacterized protein n=1 Tax=Quadrisphaera granulorum TaxID=317664 RepID=A0A316ACE2_9ACTN|nr:hypothetical protein [Quadrisphaera granulorum]PWJ55089.1 hypothetical protein BXY45_10410 [Quadrisphaera granulorum]SZE95598.1 hypothetical protein SAMN06264364_10410 [Quadrisphaera granulorum]